VLSYNTTPNLCYIDNAQLHHSPKSTRLTSYRCCTINYKTTKITSLHNNRSVSDRWTKPDIFCQLKFVKCSRFTRTKRTYFLTMCWNTNVGIIVTVTVVPPLIMTSRMSLSCQKFKQETLRFGGLQNIQIGVQPRDTGNRLHAGFTKKRSLLKNFTSNLEQLKKQKARGQSGMNDVEPY